MMTDSPYRAGKLVLSPLVGWLAGLSGAALALGAMAVLQRLADSRATELLDWLTGRSVYTLCVYFVLGGLLGVLYALCEQEGPKLALILVGLYYGLVVWVLVGLVGRPLLSPTIGSLLHTWQFLLVCLAFGSWLAGVAIWSAGRHPAWPDPLID